MYKKNFCKKEKKRTKNRVQKKTVYKNIKLKAYIGPLLPKLQPTPSFQKRIFWPTSAHRYKRTLRAYLIPNWSVDVTEKRRFPLQVILEPLPQVPVDDVIKYVKKPFKTQKIKKTVGVMDVRIASVFGGTSWWPTLSAFALRQGKTQRYALWES